jgi:hypothetical protein
VIKSLIFWLIAMVSRPASLFSGPHNRAAGLSISSGRAIQPDWNVPAIGAAAMFAAHGWLRLVYGAAMMPPTLTSSLRAGANNAEAEGLAQMADASD